MNYIGWENVCICASSKRVVALKYLFKLVSSYTIHYNTGVSNLTNFQNDSHWTGGNRKLARDYIRNVADTALKLKLDLEMW